MTAAGSSAADQLHKLYDRAAYAMGYGDGEQTQDGEGGSRRSSSDAAEGSNEEGKPIEGPGNHPGNRAKRGERRYKDHDHIEYKPPLMEQEDTDTRIDEANVSAGRGRAHDDDDDGSTARKDTASGGSASKSKDPRKQQDALERALAVDGPVGQRKGAPLDRELQKDALARQAAKQGLPKEDVQLPDGEQSGSTSKKQDNNDARKNVLQNDTVQAAAGADIGVPLQSERNMSKSKHPIRKRMRALRKGKRPESDDDTSIEESPAAQNGADNSDDDANSRHETEGISADLAKVTEQHPDQKGPAWASRPDDAQREKVRKMLEERKERHPGKGKMSAFKAWSTRKGQQGDESHDEGDDDQQQSGDANAPTAEAEQAAASGKTLFRFRLEKRLREGEKRNREENGEQLESSGGEDQEAQAQGQASSSRMSPSHRLSSFFGAQGGSSPNEARPRRSTQRSDGEGVGTPKSSHGFFANRRESQDPSGDDAQAKTGDDAQKDKKMQRIGRLMMSGTHKGGRGAEGESGAEDGEARGIDGVKMPSSSQQTPPPSARWSVLRQKIRESSVKRSKSSEPKTRVVGQMSVITELQTGILPVLMLKMALERDEQGHRRIPVFLNHVRLRISDSVNPMHASTAIFRIELEYGDGLIRWVCYRSLRDFINLHTHYRAAALKGYLGRTIGQTEGDVGLPRFPKTSLPYINQLQRQGRGKNGENVRAQFAKAQREALEDYLVELIKRTMFRPEANRLCKFFELSALSVSLAARGGYQGKQGYLRILSRSSRKDAQHSRLTPFHWAEVHNPKWFLVRESYIAIVEQPDSLQVFDVFLIDSDFEIIRPKRLYKQTIHFAHELGGSDKAKDGNSDEKGEKEEKPAADVKADPANPSHNAERKDETALLTEGQWKGEDDDEYSGSHKDKSNVSSHTFYIKNSERKLKLVANNERQMNQFIASMERVASRTIFGKANRFGSFAPIRLNCNAQWLVDGRDYLWQVSRALMRAKDRIFIHDWWLSPEVYLRRPGIPKYRLDNILKKKAEEGVKVFVIVYNEVSNNFTPTDSNYTKQRLIGLHRNIFVQRSPSHFQTGTFYWAHHEKMCVIDETIAFMGGIDLCFGRWDTPAHVLSDNIHEAVTDVPRDFVSATGADRPDHDATLVGPGVRGKEFFVWPGQDFANERVMEWYDLTKPDVDLFNRNHYPRMPWHDVGLQLIGQPARDLCRHFTQRWNFLLRIKNHKRLMPFLIPPPDFQPSELQKYDLTGTCEAQICRSAGPWSLGTNNKVEHSIQNAYLKAIQMSDHFVYIENQFFVTSTEVRGTVIENSIGDALVSRIIRAHRERTPWRAVIVIPLIPGFPLPIDHADASSVRLIVELQARSICRSENSIFGKLRRRGIDPADYIDFFSLRQWGKLPGGKLTTEQVYIHGKCMVVDDRLALIGSANINERSQRGDRDSELACVVRDTDMIDSTMGGQPYKVGRFAHSLRVRLMREHLGVDVDELDGQEAAADSQPEKMLDEDDFWDPANEQSRVDDDRGQSHVSKTTQMDMVERQAIDTIVPMTAGAKETAKQSVSRAMEHMSMNDKIPIGNGNGNGNGNEDDSNNAKSGDDVAQTLEERIKQITTDVTPEKLSGMNDKKAAANAPHSGMVVPTAEERHIAEDVGTAGKGASIDKEARLRAASSASSADMKRAMLNRMSSSPWAMPGPPPEIDAGRFSDPLDDRFYRDMWMASAVHNTQIYRKVFKCVPDDTVTTWSEYKAFQAWSDRLSRSGPAASGPSTSAQSSGTENPKDQRKDGKEANGNANDKGADGKQSSSGANPSHGHAQKHSSGMPGSSTNNTHQPQQQILPHSVASAGYSASSNGNDADGAGDGSTVGETRTDASTGKQPSSHKMSPSQTGQNTNQGNGANGAANVGHDDGFSSRELEQMERLLEMTQGTLVLHATRFLEAEDRSDNLLFNLDRLNPLNVYS